MRHILIIFFFLNTVTVTAQSFRLRIDSLVHTYDSQGSYNGIIIVAFSPDSIQTFEYGYKNPIAKKEKITVTDRFNIASLDKQFTSLALLKLIDEGIIKPEESIGRYFPELKPALQKVTVRQLANHTNGIHDYYSLTSAADSLSNLEILGTLSKLDSTVFIPGTNWGYSNSGYKLIEMLIERATKDSFQTFITKKIIAQLGMNAACYIPTNRAILTGYDTKTDSSAVKVAYTGVQGLYANGVDMVSYYITVTTGDAYWRKYFEMASKMSDDSNEKNWKYGFGWYFTQDEFGKFRAHSGRNHGFYNYVRWYEQSNVFICLLSNKNDDFIKKLREEVVALVKIEIEK